MRGQRVTAKGSGNFLGVEIFISEGACWLHDVIDTMVLCPKALSGTVICGLLF